MICKTILNVATCVKLVGQASCIMRAMCSPLETAAIQGSLADTSISPVYMYIWCTCVVVAVSTRITYKYIHMYYWLTCILYMLYQTQWSGQPRQLNGPSRSRSRNTTTTNSSFNSNNSSNNNNSRCKLHNKRKLHSKCTVTTLSMM